MTVNSLSRQKAQNNWKFGRMQFRFYDDSDSMGQSQSGAAGKGKGWKSKNMEQETLKAIVSEKESNYQFLTTVLYLFETSNFIVCFEHFFDF